MANLPKWSIDRDPIAAVGRHAFYRLRD